MGFWEEEDQHMHRKEAPMKTTALETSMTGEVSKARAPEILMRVETGAYFHASMADKEKEKKTEKLADGSSSSSHRQQQRQALEMPMGVESRGAHFDASTADKEVEKKKETKMKMTKLAHVSSSSTQQRKQQEEHHRRELEISAMTVAYFDPSVAGNDEKKKKDKKEKKRKQLADASSSSYQQEQRQEQPREMELSALLTAEEAKKWREVAVRKGLSEAYKLGMVKVVTVTDAKKDQNRWEMGPDDFSDSMALLELAVRAHSQAGSQVVTVLDRKCREYRMEYDYITSNARYRFRGREWGRFMRENGFMAEQIMRIYGLPDGRGENYGFAFINSSQ